jgi:hypothetical protein
MMLEDIRHVVTSNHPYFDKLSITRVEQHLGKMLALLAFGELVIIALFHDPAFVYRHSQKASATTTEGRIYHSR